MNKAIEETNKIYLEGASKAFDFPEFEKIDTAKNFLSILDTKEENVRNIKFWTCKRYKCIYWWTKTKIKT